MNKNIPKKIATLFLAVFGLLFFILPSLNVVQAKTYPSYEACIADNTGKQASDPTYNGESFCETFPPQGSSSTPPPAAGTGSSAVKCDSGFKFNAGTCIPDSPATGGLFDTQSIGQLITNVLKILLGLAGMLAVALIVVGGFQYISSAGNAEQAEKGKNTLVNAVIGLVIVMVSWLIISLVTNTLYKGTLF